MPYQPSLDTRPITCGELPDRYPTVAEWERAHATVGDVENETVGANNNA